QCAHVSQGMADTTGQTCPAALDHAGRAIDDDLAHGRLAGAVDAVEPGLQAGWGLTVRGWRLAHETFLQKAGVNGALKQKSRRGRRLFAGTDKTLRRGRLR